MWKIVIYYSFVNIVLSVPTYNAPNLSPVNEFSLKLLDNVYSYQENFGIENFAISSLSIWSVFSLLAEGAAGNTFQELVMSLKLPEDLKQTQGLQMSINDIFTRQYNGVIIKKQTGIFLDPSLEVHREFCLHASAFGSDMFSIDPKNTSLASMIINNYICEVTEGKIKDAVKPDFLEDLKMLLVDAMYFKANWTEPFNPEQTKEEAFYNFQGKEIGKVNMMYHKGKHNVGDSEQIGAQILEMTYGDDEQFSMIVVLPFDGMSLKKVLNNLATQSLEWLEDFRSTGTFPATDVYIPRFKITSKLDLITPLKYNGIYSIFDSDKAELPGISDVPLFISKAIQNVEVDVTEEGTTAAVATVVGLENRILGQRFEANKEFAFLIVERKSNTILFSGVYNQPKLV